MQQAMACLLNVMKAKWTIIWTVLILITTMKDMIQHKADILGQWMKLIEHTRLKDMGEYA